MQVAGCSQTVNSPRRRYLRTPGRPYSLAPRVAQGSAKPTCSFSEVPKSMSESFPDDGQKMQLPKAKIAPTMRSNSKKKGHQCAHQPESAAGATCASTLMGFAITSTC